MAIIIPDFRFE